jgi:hypothetical protein
MGVNDEVSQSDAAGYPAGYLLAYFLSEAHAEGERIRFALNPGDALRSWLTLPFEILPAETGRGLRDPFLIRDAARARFVLLATDLQTWPEQDWHRAVTQGSRALAVSESVDLIGWSEPRLVEVAPPEAGNVWAPKAFWRPDQGLWSVFWASALHGANPHATSYQRIMTATSDDFRVFTPARIAIDRGYDVIDATFVEHRGACYRLTVPHPDREAPTFVSVEVGDSIEGSDFQIVTPDLGRGVVAAAEGPAPLIAQDGSLVVLVDEFTDGGYRAVRAEDPRSGAWEVLHDIALPPGARHGSVLPLTAAEVERLRSTIR